MSSITIIDRLYGNVEFNHDDLKLFQSPELTRLRQVSLTAIPSWLQPVGVCSSKFEHSVGVAYLAKQCLQSSHYSSTEQVNLYLAALLHDIGTPPFSHASEYFQEQVFGVNHEVFAQKVLHNKQLAEIINSLGGQIDVISAYITGDQKPLSQLINGSIDLDNLDNTLRFGLSMGLVKNAYYSPLNLAKAYRFDGNQISLELESTQDLDGWEQCRREVYSFVYSPANLASGLMLYRGLDFAFKAGELTPSFFHLTDNQAFYYLETQCNQKTRYLVNQAKHWHFFKQVFNFETTKPSAKLIQLSLDISYRTQASDQLAMLLKTKPEYVTTYFRSNKKHKDITLPIYDLKGDRLIFKQRSEASCIARVYVHPELMSHQSTIQEFMEDFIK